MDATIRTTSVVTSGWVFADERGLLRVIEPDKATHAHIREAWDSFARHLEEDTPPPLTDADSKLRRDSDWHLAAMAYLAAKSESDQAAGRLEATRAALVALATHPKGDPGLASA